MLRQSWTWIGSVDGLVWVGSDFSGNCGLDWIRLDDCDSIFELVIVAAQLMLFLSNYDL